MSQVEVAKRIGYTVTAAGGDLYYVKNMSSPDGDVHSVDLRTPKCMCAHWHQHMQPCRHMAVVFFKQKMLGPSPRTARETREKFWPKWASAQNYLDLYKDQMVRRPKVYAGEFKGNKDDILGPPVQEHAKPGRPKKKRWTRRANTPKQVAKQLPTVTNAEYADVLKFV